MFPLKDDIPTRTTPFITAGLIALNVLVFLYQISLQGEGSSEGLRASRDFILEFGLVPCRLTGACAPGSWLLPPALTVLTSMFLHGGFLHVGGNMLYLWIFGNNVEDTLGHGRFLVFYLVSGTAAAAAQTALSATSSVPMIGASGAVSGVLGAYLLLFPRANVLTLIVLGFFVRLVRVPAVLVLGLWFLVQFLSGLATWGGRHLARRDRGRGHGLVRPPGRIPRRDGSALRAAAAQPLVPRSKPFLVSSTFRAFPLYFSMLGGSSASRSISLVSRS